LEEIAAAFGDKVVNLTEQGSTAEEAALDRKGLAQRGEVPTKTAQRDSRDSWE
jgi:hypothetical protein